MGKTEDKRRSRRRRVLKEGKIILDAAPFSIKCLVRDYSDGGAKLRLTASTKLPKAFRLLFVTEGSLYPTELVWRHGDDLGVAFTGEAELPPPPV